jgi:Zn-dependent protease
MPFKCPYCQQLFCVEHRLPENHNCPEYWMVKGHRSQTGNRLKTTEAQPSYQYKVTMVPPHNRGKIISFSRVELKHLLIGALLTLAIGVSMPMYSNPGLYGYPEIFITISIVFTVSFLVHELAHKTVAQHYGLWAEFRITMFGALITMLSIISPFKIISPGAVMVAGIPDRETIGKTSIAGPVTNIVLALIFLGLAQMLSGAGLAIAEFGFLINSIIALFNLIPFSILDGVKIYYWNRKVWATSFTVSLALTIYAYSTYPFL